MANIVQLLDSAADATPLSLATDAGDIISDCVANGVQLVQTAQGVRAKNARPINRGNMANKVQLVITYKPAASPLVAKQNQFALIAALKTKLPTVTLADFIWNATTFRLTDAALENYTLRAQGTTVFGTFNFIGGDISQYP